ncbi:tRNA-splicing ligase RtcB [Sulfuritortus calidifontis]|uniref:tRNA-splicing ligase RtcB n=1 Tax=Sulfuritortus calidifontis TaxID=1914471 RepID=A0A4V2UQW4_9PROT|nr:RtcB family protein [Sulfuritortus calidifontis]TCS72987.1 tRNA-splicing ligase RtcB [Sulfuritortus calidifontis]
MDMARLRQLDDYCFTVPRAAGEVRSEVLLYGSAPLLRTMDDMVLTQITNVAKLPGLVGPAMTMPDAHWGYGFPIGGVAAFDPDLGGIVSAGGVGFDISCGIRCLRSNLELKDAAAQFPQLADALFQAIPAGVGEEGALKLSSHELDQVMLGGAEWAVHQGYGSESDLALIEEHGKMRGAVPGNVSELAKKRQRGEMGTLGSGNHYLEVQVVEKIFDTQAARAFGLHEGQLLVSIHCGSRGLGHQIGTDYLVSLAKAASRLGIVLPDRELACAPINSPEGQEYLGAMNAAINVALANRQILAHLTRAVFARVIPGSHLATLYDVSHNTCKLEKHRVDGKDRMLYVHRKGATRAFGPNHPALPAEYQAVGQPVIIGGSMGTGSYVLAGTAEGERRAWSSASHGAGRAMSRNAALKKWRGRELIEQLKGQGILIRTKSMRGAAEEAPGAYKDVDLVAEATEKAGLARRVAFLRPKVCIKG